MSLTKAHEGRGLQYERKVMKIKKVKEIRSPNQKGGKVNETGIWAGGPL